MPRLFTGLEVPQDVAQVLSLLRGGMAGANWVEPGNYHLTLRFVGDVDHAQGAEVFAILEQIRHSPVTVTLDALHAFGKDKPRALVARAAAAPALCALQNAQEKLMQRIGLAPEARKFVPHVTLAWLRGASPPAVADFIGGRGLFAPLTFEASSFALYSARDAGGGPYRVEATYPLIAISARDGSPRRDESTCR